MTQRLAYTAVAPEALRFFSQAGHYLRTATTLEPTLLHLVFLRASQMNGCAFCIAMHWREAHEDGIDDDRLHGLSAWREAPWYSDRERAALAWTEAVTDVMHSHVPDDVYVEARSFFSEHELVDLTLAVNTINAWNRFAIAFRTPPETAAGVLEALRAGTRHTAAS
ncbi:MAG TPA: carboxymuconolactone decarboxylase family protein [Acidobacteriaceae bacterium]|jgi:AhpD family alkylhydroperoxidase|nr:carboxymuconolactone decarboxylase family protein [Acidobacteriaceae bacterium]